MSKVTLTGFITVSEDDNADVLNALPNHIKLSRKEPGCLVFKVTQDESIMFRFKVYEEFESKAAFEQHQSRVRSSLWGKITKNIERNYNVEGL